VVARLRLLLGLALLWAVVPVAAQIPLGNGMAVADFNNDGIPDVLLQSTQTSSFTLSFGAVPYGTFSPTARTLLYPAGCTNVVRGATVIGDFNGDGFQDIALTCLGGSSSTSIYTIYILLGVGDGTFVNKTSFDGRSFLAAGDFNRDGVLDLAAGGSDGVTNTRAIDLMTGVGDGTFVKPVTSTVSSPFYSTIAVADINHDGYPDVVLGNFSNQTTSTVDVFGNNQNGTFGVIAPATGITSPNVSGAVGSYPNVFDRTMLPGSFFSIGGTDIAVVDIGSAPGIYLLQNTSSGGGYSFAAATKVLSAGLVDAKAASFASGFTDLLGYDGALLGVLANDGTGNFSFSYGSLSLLNTSSLFSAADANADGHADVYSATTTGTGSSITVALVSGTASASSLPFRLPAGTATIGAAWPGNVNFSGASATGSQIVNAIASALVLTSSLNASFVGNSVTFTALVSPPNSGVFSPTGTVTFFDGTTSLGVTALGQGGVATLTTSALTAGAHAISAVYSGDSIFAGSSQSLTQQVNLNVSALTWTNPAAITYGTALSGAQLNATAVDAGGVAIAGTFAYTPTLGTVLNAGTQTLSVTFTPANPGMYTGATGTVSLVVNQAATVVSWTPQVASITYGTALGAQQLNATTSGSGGVAVAGTFVYAPASGAVLGVGRQVLGVVFTPTSANYTGASGAAAITVTQATPTIVWSTPAPLAYGIPLGATHLNAAATGAAGAALPGTFVYTPAVGAVLTPGVQRLSVTFTPTDLVDYVTASATVNLTITDITLTSFTPNAGLIGDPNKTVTITGSGFVATTVAQVNGVAIATTLVNPTTLTAVVPAANFAGPGTLQISLKNPATGSVSASLPLAVSTLPAGGTLTGPATTPPGSQPVLNFTVPGYPVDLVATFSLSAKSALASGVTDPNVLFSNGSTTYSFTIKAATTTVPTIQLQAGTVAETITVPLVLTASGINVTPANLVPVVIVVPPAVPSATATTLTRSGNQLTVTVTGFSNTREIVQANFHFVAAAGASLTTTDFTANVASVFATYFADPASVPFGSSFVYTQNFTVDGNASDIGSVQVTLTNTVGVSAMATAQ